MEKKTTKSFISEAVSYFIGAGVGYIIGTSNEPSQIPIALFMGLSVTWMIRNTIFAEPKQS
jgi:hypothetical protein